MVFGDATTRHFEDCCSIFHGVKVPFLAAAITDASCEFKFGSAPYTTEDRLSNTRPILREKISHHTF
jgi:hypothetical protein